MALSFYPSAEDMLKGTFAERIETLMEAAQRYKAAVLDTKISDFPTMPKELKVAFNWEEVALLLKEIRELPESNKAEKSKKWESLTKLAEVYEVLRAAKMPKLEAVRLALMGEADHLAE